MCVCMHIHMYIYARTQQYFIKLCSTIYLTDSIQSDQLAVEYSDHNWMALLKGFSLVCYTFFE